MRYHEHLHQYSGSDNNFIPFLTLLVTIGTLVTAVYALDTWKKQFKGTHNYELAKRLSVASYEFRYQVRGVRSPFVPGDAETAYQQRWNNLLTPAKNLKTALLEAEIVWNKAAAQKLEARLDKLVGELNLSIEMYLMSKQDSNKDAADELFTLEQAYILYANRQQPNDKYAEKINKLIDDIETLATPYLKI